MVVSFYDVGSRPVCLFDCKTMKYFHLSRYCACLLFAILMGIPLFSLKGLSLQNSKQIFFLSSPNSLLFSSKGKVFLPDPACPNFLIVTSEPGGLGHRAGAIAIALSLAAETGASIVLDDGLWHDARYNQSLGYIYNLLGLNSFLSTRDLGFVFSKGPSAHTYKFSEESYLTPWGRVYPTYFNFVEQAIDAVKNACFTVTLIPTGHSACSRLGSPHYCFEIVPRFFDRSRSILSALYARSQNHHKNIFPHFNKDEFVVAWHIRYGDIIIRPDIFAWKILINDVQKCTSSIKTKHLIFSETPITPEDAIFGFLYKIQDFSFTVLDKMSSELTFKYLVAADMLIHTGSSFASAAGAVADISQVFLYSRPKETAVLHDDYYNAYYLNGCVPVQTNGSILDIGQCHNRVLSRKNISFNDVRIRTSSSLARYESHI
jgi:hypothetical protein